MTATHHCTLHYSDQVKGELADTVFGQFMERASFGEPGPESACDENGRLRPQALQLLKTMSPPLTRFPGGTDVDFLDWHDLIDHAPGRATEPRPVQTGRNDKYIGTRFGLLEYLQCMQDIGAEPLLVVNVGDSWRAADKQAAVDYHCAAMLAYVNAPLNNTLPAHLKAYPEARAKAGFPKPFGVRKWQIGNETWILNHQDKRLPQNAGEWLPLQRDCLQLAINAMKTVDPDISLIIDGGSAEQIAVNFPAFKDQVDYFSYHHYKPMGGRLLKDRAGRELPPNALGAEELYRWMVAAPDTDGDGNSTYRNACWDYIREHQVPIAFTEWNWNGWFGENHHRVAENNWHWRGIGAAGMLHGIMRDCHLVRLACQSMLIGSGWGIMSIRVHPEDDCEPFMNPSGMVTELYSKHHGSQLLDCSCSGGGSYVPTYTNDNHAMLERVSWVDALLSRDEHHLYLHVINRRRRDTSAICLKGIQLAGCSARHYSMVQDTPHTEHRRRCASRIDCSTLEIGAEQRFVLPPASVNVIKIAL